MLQADPDQPTTVAPGWRGRKNPAAMAPVWRETPARLAALARLTVSGVLGDSLIQRQVRVDRRTPAQQIPGTHGLTATPTAAVVVAWCAPIARVQVPLGDHEGAPGSGVQPYPLRGGDALGLDRSWDETPSAQKSGRSIQTP
jgi:hypothetical protein